MKYLKRIFENEQYWRNHISKSISSFAYQIDMEVIGGSSYRSYNKVGIEYLIGKIIDDIKINNNEDEIAFFLSNGELLVLYHEDDCCESFWLEDFDGEPYEICNCKIMSAEERISDDEEKMSNHSYDDSITWTFYVIRSLRGTVTIRFCGTSSGYYSERCDVLLFKPK